MCILHLSHPPFFRFILYSSILTQGDLKPNSFAFLNTHLTTIFHLLFHINYTFIFSIIFTMLTLFWLFTSFILHILVLLTISHSFHQNLLHPIKHSLPLNASLVDTYIQSHIIVIPISTPNTNLIPIVTTHLIPLLIKIYWLNYHCALFNVLMLKLLLVA